MRRRAGVIAALVPLALLAPLPAAASTGTCSSLPVAAPAGTTVESVTAVHKPGGTVTFPDSPLGPQPPITGVPAYCEFTVTLNHPGADDHVHTTVDVPDTGWTGRFQAVGGSAYAAGDFVGNGLVQAVKDGYAAGTTDAGLPGNPIDAGWGRAVNGKELLTDFAYRSEHDLAVVGKDLTARYYGHPVTYSYWNGCSTGGRQGYAEAQRYPGDFNGINAGAPAVFWAQFAVATLWPAVAMNQEHDILSGCELAAFNAGAVKACAGPDGLIDRPDQCGFDPRSLIGTQIVCDGKQITISARDADVVRKIWNGPTDEHGRRLWGGLPKGADFAGIAGTVAAPDGSLTAPGFVVADQWVQNFLLRQPALDVTKITYAQFDALFRQSVAQYDNIIGTADPDLSRFRAAGGKLLTTVGTADQLIPTSGLFDYRRQVDRLFGGTQRVDDFYRLFVVPGGFHCVGGAGATPTDPLKALVDWVEHGKAPATLPAANADGSVTRDLCRFPKVSRYLGHGDPAAASSYRCA
ncbi:tannase/feruloyl esterase family alpha/beta hydrolase [Kutzneria buriramensis]|uniref:Tannase/feruloyl esterase n=1 Tax=Kutzneria buriramensis TaxID=1045776 RepID=A0A3E0HZA0_9PSEU|nr:tannase/feruloyl esterase family alpha/beta hydrolase [Kutzneria buriramensis]REH51596.1 tannase/feruloyl esterase [Kutzneria buriramensis]